MTADPWWKNAGVYQIYPRSFADADGDGIGDLAGAIQHLDHLAALGVDVVWLSPVYRSPQADNGYDISDYQDIDPVFGDLATFDRLLEGLHARGIRLVMDLVVNHTSDEHPWFVEARSSRTSPKRDWYVWRDPRDPASDPSAPSVEPNNWASFFAGPAWTLDPPTGQYYLHLFDPKQPDLNWENPEVRHAVHSMMRWWLDRGVDGFRMDVINVVSKTSGLPDGAPVPGRPYGDGFPLVCDGPRMHEFLAEMHREVFAGREDRRLTVGEMPGVTTEQARLYTDPARAEVDMVFQFEHMQVDAEPGDRFRLVPLDRPALRETLYRWQRGLADVGWNSLYWNNHDQPRAVSRFGDDDPAWRERSAKTLGTLLHGLRGTPYVYQGEELGMTNFPFTALPEHRDVEAVNHYAAAVAAGRDPVDMLAALARGSRDNARTPMQWDASPHAGFSTAEPWIAVNPNHVEINAAEQVGRPGSVFEHYRALVQLRHEQPVLADGDFADLLPGHPTLWAYRRTSGRHRLLVLGQCDRAPVTVDPVDLLDPADGGPGWAGSRLLLGTLESTPDGAGERPAPEPTLPDGPITLAGWEARIYLQEVAG
jgi:oligo-1,6-glucosidase